jgi:hypothetical protein
MRTRFASYGLFSLALLAGCSRVIQHGPIITEYESAECISPHLGPGITPPTHVWDRSVTDSLGQNVRILGAEMPGGRIDVRYESDGADIVAANAGDYIYPADVRIDKLRQRLLVKASGITAAFSLPQTWLFEFDLTQRRLVDRARVDPKVLPQECNID